MTKLRTELQEQAKSSIIQHALFRWENAVVIAATILLTLWLPQPFAWWPRIGWPVLGTLAVLALFASSLTDIEANAKLLLKLYQQRFDTSRIRDNEMRGDVRKALEYQKRIEQQINQRKDTRIKGRLEATATEITEWVSNVYTLASRIDRHRNDKLLLEERHELPKEIDALIAKRDQTKNETLKAQMNDVIASKTNHWQSIQDLDVRMQQAALQLDQSITALATIYSQIQLIDAQSVNSGRAKRLQGDIQEQVAQLGDLVESINDVYNT